MNDVVDCTRANMAMLSLVRASEEVIQSVNNIRVSGANGASSYRMDLLERQWKYYKSLGGTAASPEQVRMPEDPCKEAKEALQRTSVTIEAQYRDCGASHPKEMRLSALSKELLSGRGYLATLEKIRDEKRSNPNFDSGFKGSGEWAAAFKADPALVRAELAVKFQEYRSAGGPASRLEDVREILNPCIPEANPPARASPIADKRTLTLPRQ